MPDGGIAWVFDHEEDDVCYWDAVDSEGTTLETIACPESGGWCGYDNMPDTLNLLFQGSGYPLDDYAYSLEWNGERYVRYFSAWCQFGFIGVSVICQDGSLVVWVEMGGESRYYPLLPLDPPPSLGWSTDGAVSLPGGCGGYYRLLITAP